MKKTMRIVLSVLLLVSCQLRFLEEENDEFATLSPPYETETETADADMYEKHIHVYR